MKWILFVLLKLGEASAVVFIPWGLGTVIRLLCPTFYLVGGQPAFSMFRVWLCGILILVCMVGAGMAVAMIYLIIVQNIRWAEELTYKIRHKKGDIK